MRVRYSSFNYKDGLACLPESPVVTSYPMVPGIDLAGTVTESDDPRFSPGQEVIAIAYMDATFANAMAEILGPDFGDVPGVSRLEDASPPPVPRLDRAAAHAANSNL